MSLKKRMFRSNMMILFTALVALMLILVGVLVIFEDSFENQFHSLTQTRLDSHIEEAVRLVREAQPGEEEQLRQELAGWDYQTALIADGSVLSGDRSENMKDLAEHFIMEDNSSGETGIYLCQNASVAGKYIEEENAVLVAVHFPRESRLPDSVRPLFFTFLIVLVLTGIGAIAVLLLLAAFFTRRMNRVVMEPVGELVAAAERVQQGNLEEKISYQGEAEFEDVCQAFNAMQDTILEDQKQREKNERARTDMITGISHDLRTPLTSIQGYIKGVLDNIADTDQKRELYLRTAYESTEEMNVLLKKLFDFSRVESGQLPFYLVKVDLAEFTSAYIAQKEAVMDPERVQMVFEKAEGEIPEVAIDIEQVPRIFDNLLENSIKYADRLPARIQVRIFIEEARVVLEWKDKGPGVPEEKLPRIFDRFYRCDEARTIKGSGVGLYIVKYIMERHGGTVKAENEEGLKIRLYFPERSKDGENIDRRR